MQPYAILEKADHVCGTGGMAKYAKENKAQDFIVVTECGMNAKLQEDVPDKNFYSFCNVCPYMKSTTLPLVARSLIQEKHEVTACDNGLDAIEKCREHRFDLVITDLMMPTHDGFDVLEHARKILPTTPVIMITAYATIESAVHAIQKGASDYIVKPFSSQKIIPKNRSFIHNIF